MNEPFVLDSLDRETKRGADRHHVLVVEVLDARRLASIVEPSVASPCTLPLVPPKQTNTTTTYNTNTLNWRSRSFVLRMIVSSPIEFAREW